MELEELELNENAAIPAEELLSDPEMANVEVHDVGDVAVVDCGVHVPGSLFAGQILAETCLVDRARVGLYLDRLGDHPCGKVTVDVDEPAIACLLSQYAGWKIEVGDYFAMGSGPMRALHASEPVFKKLGYSEEADVAVGVLEASSLPNESVVEYLCQATRVDADSMILLVARTASIAGCYQVVARSVETCMHKLYELDFDVTRVRSAIGSAFLPPVPKDDLTAIGRTNDSILYGGEVILWVEGDDASIEEIGKQVPSCSSPAHGAPFKELFEKSGGDFYKIDPLLFSPAVVVFNNLTTGSVFQFGKTDFDLVRKSFFGA